MREEAFGTDFWNIEQLQIAWQSNGVLEL